MSDISSQSKPKLFLVVNPDSGRVDEEVILPTVEQYCSEKGWSCECYVMDGTEQLADISRDASERGVSMVMAAGGDGTLAGVASGLVNRQTPFAILPVGTGNGLARALHVPLRMEAALELALGDHLIREIDMMKVGDRYFMINVSAGFSALSMDQTPPEEKKILGLMAYMERMVRILPQHSPQIFNLKIDGRELKVRAGEVLVLNGRVFSDPPYLFGPRETFSDGRFNVYILTTTNPAEIALLAAKFLIDPEGLQTDLFDLSVSSKIYIDTEDGPLSVQADGDVIGETPVLVEVVPHALRVVVPPVEEEEQKDNT